MNTSPLQQHGFAAALLALVLGACSSAPTRPTKPTTVNPFITSTAIDFPQTLVNARLVNHNAFGQVGAGIGIIYRLNDLPDVVFDVFVYPAGRMPPESMLKEGQAVLLESLKLSREQGNYVEQDVQGQEPFPIVLAAGRPLPGIKTRIASRKTADGEALVSRAYLFSRHFYFIKLRLTASAGDADRLDALADAAARDLVPRIASRSRGECLQIAVLADGDSRMPAPLSEQANPAGTVLMLRSRHSSTLPAQQRMSASGELGCLGRDEPPPLAPDYSRRVLQFKPDDWGPGSQSSPPFNFLGEASDGPDSGRRTGAVIGLSP